MFLRPCEYGLRAFHSCHKAVGSAVVSYQVNRKDDDLPSRSDLDDGLDRIIFQREPSDTVFRLNGLLIPLSLEDYAGQNNMLNIENGQEVVGHFPARMLGNNVSMISDSVSYSKQNSIEHARESMRVRCRRNAKNSNEVAANCRDFVEKLSRKFATLGFCVTGAAQLLLPRHFPSIAFQLDIRRRAKAASEGNRTRAVSEVFLLYASFAKKCQVEVCDRSRVRQ
jgi:hypothetical protein